MSYSDDFNQWQAAIEGVLKDDMKQPNQPVDDFAEKTETLAVQADSDREALLAAGLAGTIIDALTPLAGAMRYCQAEWMAVYNARGDAQKLWNEESPEAFAFRDALLHHFSFAYRNKADVLKKVARIREGGSNTDMVQDLLELAILGKKYPDPLATIHFDMEQLTTARTLSHTLAKALAAANGVNSDGSAEKLLRDKAFTLLYEKEATVREYGRYVFWKDEDKRSRYNS